MYDSQVFKEAKTVIEENGNVLESLFQFLPYGTEISIILEDRIPCALVKSDKGVALEPRKALNADVEIGFFPESIRRLRESQPGTLAALGKELLTMWVAKLITYKIMSSPQTLYEKGYVQAIKNAGPELQKELSKHAMTVLTTATFAVEAVKQKWVQHFKKD